MSARPLRVEEAYPQAPSAPPTPRISAVPSVTSQQRRARTSRIAHAAFRRIIATATIVTTLVIGYVMLTASLTRTNFQIVKAQRERTALSDETTQLEDKLEHLESRDRLAAIAAKLGMHDASAYAVVEIPVDPAVARHRTRGLAFFPSLAGWIK